VNRRGLIVRTVKEGFPVGYNRLVPA
jgi:hypothetical protein